MSKQIMYTVKVGMHQYITIVENTDDQVSTVCTRCKHHFTSRCVPEPTSQLRLRLEWQLCSLAKLLFTFYIIVNKSVQQESLCPKPIISSFFHPFWKILRYQFKIRASFLEIYQKNLTWQKTTFSQAFYDFFRFFRHFLGFLNNLAICINAEIAPACQNIELY